MERVGYLSAPYSDSVGRLFRRSAIPRVSVRLWDMVNV